MSPFEAANDRLTGRISGLSHPAQVALFAGAAQVLRRRYVDWVGESGADAEDRGELLSRAIAAGRAYATGDADATADALLQEVEAGAPGEPSDVRWATAAQDCWVCADTAVRSSLGGYAAQDATWYLLESMFQATSERLFGVTDVGSERQDELEAQALEDPGLAAAVAAVDRAIDELGAGSLDEDVLDQVVETLEPISP